MSDVGAVLMMPFGDIELHVSLCYRQLVSYVCSFNSLSNIKRNLVGIDGFEDCNLIFETRRVHLFGVNKQLTNDLSSVIQL